MGHKMRDKYVMYNIPVNIPVYQGGGERTCLGNMFV